MAESVGQFSCVRRYLGCRICRRPMKTIGVCRRLPSGRPVRGMRCHGPHKVALRNERWAGYIEERTERGEDGNVELTWQGECAGPTMPAVHAALSTATATGREQTSEQLAVPTLTRVLARLARTEKAGERGGGGARRVPGASRKQPDCSRGLQGGLVLSLALSGRTVPCIFLRTGTVIQVLYRSSRKPACCLHPKRSLGHRYTRTGRAETRRARHSGPHFYQLSLCAGMSSPESS
jgi:hypothetical protein